MDEINYYELISKRGDATGGHGGLLDLLIWCGKFGVVDVTAEEAKRFYEDPNTPYDKAGFTKRQ